MNDERIQATKDPTEARLEAMERSHSCPHFADRAKWCEREPCDTAWAIAEIRRLRRLLHINHCPECMKAGSVNA